MLRLSTRLLIPCVVALLTMQSVAYAGPPYISDDPQPTDLHHYEIYLFHLGTVARDGSDGQFGVDFNYGGARDLQLTVVLPMTFERPTNAPHATALGNIELAAKYRFLHQDDVGWDVAFFPRVFLPSASHRVGDQHVSILLPLWLERDWGKWSTFGGGGCTINHGGDSIDFCLASWALARQFTPRLQLGAEVFHQTPDAHSARSTSGLNLGARYDLTENIHLLGAFGRGIQNTTETNQYSWYASMLLTF